MPSSACKKKFRLVIMAVMQNVCLGLASRVPDIRLAVIVVFFLMIRRPRSSTLFPSTTLFRSLSPTLDKQSIEAERLLARWAALHAVRDRKSTRLNSSHLGISYAVFCLKKK